METLSEIIRIKSENFCVTRRNEKLKLKNIFDSICDTFDERLRDICSTILHTLIFNLLFLQRGKRNFA